MHDLLGARRQCAAVLARIYEFFLSSISCMADFCELEAKDSPMFSIAVCTSQEPDWGSRDRCLFRRNLQKCIHFFLL